MVQIFFRGAFWKIPAGIKFLLDKALAADGYSRAGGGRIIGRHIGLQTRAMERTAFPNENLGALSWRL
jgi:hypothetical protein